MTAWQSKANALAFGVLKLKPWELDRLTLFEFYDMVNAYTEAKTAERWETAYWIANIISPHMKKPARVEKLMKPFLKPKTKLEREQEAEEFYKDFERQRKEANDGKR